MQLLKDKRALSSYNYGHHIFGIIILTLVVLIIIQFTKVPLWDIVQKNLIFSLSLIFVYIIFSDFLDLLEKPSGYNHRGPLHSKTALIIYIALIPITIEKAITTANGCWLYATAFLCSNCVHLFGDSLTKSLKKW
jgi:hypothetical protein